MESDCYQPLYFKRWSIRRFFSKPDPTADFVAPRHGGTVPRPNNLKMIVGLGNPGKKFAETRHNAGFMVLREIAEKFSIAVDRKKFDARYGRGTIHGHAVVLAQPIAFMNRSGPPIQKLAHYHRIPDQNLTVIYDDIDLEFGRIKIKEKGGHGGHKGIKSLIDALGRSHFTRIRIGIGRPRDTIDAAAYVLGRFDSDERQILERLVARGCEAAVAVLCDGVPAAMNRFNQKRATL